MKELTENLDELAKSTPVLILQFGEDICGPCHSIRSKLDKWLETSQMGIFSAPTVIVYVEGQVAAKESGYFSLDAFLERIERYLDLLSLGGESI